ncbi:MmgE/PrpD family protein [Bordetella genomosp. 13]|uniref:MmgE/PrpD family protein n=1 Tax=Bordetella genomosp. 13 TaxID=463040 RepID=UPI0011A9EA48|nr:MmgE/PrpD family protein [Bordetella genomosp. 13]
MAADTVSLSAELAQALLQARHAGLPDDLRAKTRLHFADALGIALAARRTELARQVIDGLLAGHGAGTSGLIGGGQAAPLAAAFVNASLIHILDYDDIHDVGRLHPSTCVLPAAMAAAGLVNATDEVVVDAVALGSELTCRLGVICAPQGEGPGSEWFLTQLFGYLGAGMAAGLVLGLDPRQLVSTLGLAYMQLAGGKEAGFGTGATARGIYPAFAAQGGLQAALLARAGVSGPARAMDGAAGLFRLYLAGALSTRQCDMLLDFSFWHARDVDIKPWPSCRLSHPYVAVAMAARDACRAHPQARIRVAVNPSSGRLCRPLAQRRSPATLQDAKYSIPFMTAYALVHGAPTLQGLSNDVLTDEAVLRMAGRIELEDGLPDNPGHPPAVLTLLDEGRVVRQVHFAPDDLCVDAALARKKFEDCLRYASRSAQADALWRALAQGRVNAAFDMVFKES